MSQRARTARLKRRARRESYARTEREWVIGGPLTRLDEPITSGGSGWWHAQYVEQALLERARVVQAEADMLARHFARRCWLTTDALATMLADYDAMLAAVGGPYIPPTHSTAPEVGATTIPRLEVAQDG